MSRAGSSSKSRKGLHRRSEREKKKRIQAMKMRSRIRELRRSLRTPPTTWKWYIAGVFGGGVLIGAIHESGKFFCRIDGTLLGWLTTTLLLMLLALGTWLVFLKNELGVKRRYIEKNHGLVDPDKEEWESEVFSSEFKRLEDKEASEPSAARDAGTRP